MDKIIRWNKPEVTWSNIPYVLSYLMNGVNYKVLEYYFNNGDILESKYSFPGKGQDGLVSLIEDVSNTSGLSKSYLEQLLVGRKERFFSFELQDLIFRSVYNISEDQNFAINVALEHLNGPGNISVKKIMKNSFNIKYGFFDFLLTRAIAFIRTIGHNILSPGGIYNSLSWSVSRYNKLLNVKTQIRPSKAEIYLDCSNIDPKFRQDDFHAHVFNSQLKVIPALIGLPLADVEFEREGNYYMFLARWVEAKESLYKAIWRQERIIDELIQRDISSLEQKEQIIVKQEEIIRERTHQIRLAYSELEKTSLEASTYYEAMGDSANDLLLTSAIINLEKGNVGQANRNMSFFFKKMMPYSKLSDPEKDKLLKIFCYKIKDYGRKLGGISTDIIWSTDENKIDVDVIPFYFKEYYDWMRALVEERTLIGIEEIINQAPTNSWYRDIKIPELWGQRLTIEREDGRTSDHLIMSIIEAPSFYDVNWALQGREDIEDIVKFEFIKQCGYKINRLKAAMQINPIDLGDNVPKVKVDFAKNIRRNLVENLNYLGVDYSDEQMSELCVASRVFNNVFNFSQRVQYMDWNDTNVLINVGNDEPETNKSQSDEYQDNEYQDNEYQDNDNNENETQGSSVEDVTDVEINKILRDLRKISSDESSVAEYVSDKIILHRIDFNKTNRYTHLLEDSRHIFSYQRNFGFDTRQEDIHFFLCRERESLVKRVSQTCNDENDGLSSRIESIDKLIDNYEKGVISLDENEDLVSQFVDLNQINQILETEAKYVDVYRSLKWFNHYLRKYLPQSKNREDAQNWVDEANYSLDLARKSLNDLINSNLVSCNDKKNLVVVSNALNKIGQISLDKIDIEALGGKSLVQRAVKKVYDLIKDTSPDKYLNPHLFNVREWYLRLEPDATQAEQFGALMHDLDRVNENVELDQFPKEDYSSQEERYQAYKSATAKEAADYALIILQELGAPGYVIDEVLYYVMHHDDKSGEAYDNLDKENPLFPNLEMIITSDSIDYLETNLPIYFKQHQKNLERIKMKINFMRDVIPERYQKVADYIISQRTPKVFKFLFAP